MSTVAQRPATLDDLHGVEGKAELVAGRIVQSMASGYEPTIVAAEIYVALREYAKARGVGVAFPDGIGYAIRPPLPNGRESFSPDASYYTGPLPVNRSDFIDGPPDFAVDVRSKNDVGPAAEAEMAAKRDDYFLSGTSVVWDVDPVTETVAVYRPADPATPTVFRRGDTADAEPAVPGWHMAVDRVFG